MLPRNQSDKRQHSPHLDSGWGSEGTLLNFPVSFYGILFIALLHTFIGHWFILKCYFLFLIVNYQESLPPMVEGGREGGRR